VRGVPTVFHLGPLAFHTYGLGLAIAAWIAVAYLERRFRERGISDDHMGRFIGALLIAGLIGARLVSVATNWSLYSHHLGQIFALWHGGLASFGGLAFAIPVGLILIPRQWPAHSALEILDVMLPAIVLGWAVGRVLGPQFMVAGGGHLTHQWFGLSYQGQVGKRVPVPLIQGGEDAMLWLALLLLERRSTRVGVVTGTAMVVWGLVRSADEHWLLGQEGRTGSVGVQIAGLVLAALGAYILVRTRRSGSTRSS
jgi:phosphatidylglycerol:prolipoprotein diacylglycerol transferase